MSTKSFVKQQIAPLDSRVTLLEAGSSAANAELFLATSTTSNTIGIGAKTFAIETGRAYVAGLFVQVADQASPSNYMLGQIVSYSGTTLELDVVATSGSGTHSAWYIGLSGPGMANAMDKAGDTMTGPLILSGDPTTALQAATKSYVDGIVAAQDAMVFKGLIDASGNPNYPDGNRGWTYRISVGGKIGGASGVVVEPNDIIICLTDNTSSGSQSAVGAEWGVIQTASDADVMKDALFGKDYGALPSSFSAGFTSDRVASGNGDDSSLFYGRVERTKIEGSEPLVEVRNVYSGLNIDTTANVTTAIVNHSFVWKQNAGNITNARVWEAHVRHDGPGTVSVAKNYSIVTSIDPSILTPGSITQSEGYSSGEIGHTTKINRAYDFFAQDGSPCVTARVSYRSELNAHPNKLAFQGAGSAASAFGGWVAVGKPTAPSHPLDAIGATPDFAGSLNNEHPSTPYGLKIRFGAAAPNNTTQGFLRCEDNVGFRLHIWSNGNIVNLNNSYGAISDERLKTDIEETPSVLEKFADRRFITYRLKADPEGVTLRGVIAQEEMAHSPHLVTEGEDGFLSYNYAGLAVETAQAVKELLNEVRNLRRQVADLGPSPSAAAG